MSRDEYIRHSCVRAFIDWLRPYVRGDCLFQHSFTMLRPYREWCCDSLWQAYERYEWNGVDIDVNRAELDCLAACVRRAVREDDRSAFVGAASGILRWGGVTRGNVATLRNLGTEALRTFRDASRLLDPSHAHTSRLEGVRYMNSGWTKVYALMLNGLPIYDGRVGAAMGYLVQKHCRDAGLDSVPDLLHFRWGPARGNHNRNPSSGLLRFRMLSTASPRSWAECNVRAAWILGEVCGEGKFGDLPPARGLRALEAALFMIGYEIPEGHPS